MAQILDKQGLQHYANKMCNADNRKVGSKNLPTTLNEIDIAIDGFKTLFETEYGTPVNMELENNENVFSIGTGTNIDKKDDVENSFTDVELSGNSLVNLADEWKDVTNETISFYYGAERSICKTSKLKNNTYYTLIVNYKINRNNTTAYNAMELGLSNSKNSVTSHPSGGETNYSFDVKDGLNVIKFHFSNYKHDEYTYFNIRPIRRYTDPVEGESVTLSCSDLILLEGDWTNKPIPQYFQGLKSVGEKEDGNHKIEILSKNRNEYEGKTQYLNNNNATILSKEDNECIFEHRQINQGIKIDIEKNIGKEIVLSYDVELLEGSTLNWGGHNRHTQIAYCIDGINQNTSYHSGKPISMEIGRTYKIDLVLRIENWSEQYINDYKYIGIEPNRYSSNTPTYTKVKITNFQITQSRELYPYIQPKLNKKEISLNEPLRSVGDTKDTIEKINGEWKIVRRCGEVVLNGSEDWSKVNYNHNDLCTRIDLTIPTNSGRLDLVCNNIPVCADDNTKKENFYIAGHNNKNRFVIILPNSKLSSATIEGAKEWLSKNNATVVYLLPTPIIEDILPITLQCWKNGTISIDEVLPVETTHTVALNKSAQIQKNIEELTLLRNRIEALEKQYDNSTLNQAYELELLRLDMQLDNII